MTKARKAGKLIKEMEIRAKGEVLNELSYPEYDTYSTLKRFLKKYPPVIVKKMKADLKEPTKLAFKKSSTGKYYLEEKTKIEKDIEQIEKNIKRE